MRLLCFRIRPLTIAIAVFAFSQRAEVAAWDRTTCVLVFLRGPQGGQSVAPLAKSKIKHVIIVVQENRIVQQSLSWLPGATTQSWGYDSQKKKIALKPVPLTRYWDMQHNGQGFITSCNGTGKIPGTDCRMNGFDRLKCQPLSKCPKGKKGQDLSYSYAPQDETEPYFDMAHQYVLADQMYASDFDVSSFESHQYIIAGINPESTVDYPDISSDWGCPGGKLDQIPVLLKGRIWLNHNTDIKTVRTCWDPNTIADELDAKKLPWAFYAAPVKGSGRLACTRGTGNEPDGSGSGNGGIWSAYQAIKHICYGPDWAADVVPFSPPSKFLTDIAGGELRAVTWITPTCADSDHAGCNGGASPSSGPSWVTSVVNAIGHSKFWDSCAIFIFWDDSGGWYDPEPPQYLKDSYYDSLGYRLPLLIISPYAKKGYVDHTHYEHGTILKFVENTFGLPPLGNTNGQGAFQEATCARTRQKRPSTSRDRRESSSRSRRRSACSISSTSGLTACHRIPTAAATPPARTVG